MQPRSSSETEKKKKKKHTHKLEARMKKKKPTAYNSTTEMIQKYIDTLSTVGQLCVRYKLQ